jgi:protein O-GlcNAc transferase
VGYCLFDFNMNAAARTALQTATALMPQNDKAFVLLGMAENRLLHKDEALLAFEQALKIDPTSIDANVNYGILQQGKGKNDLAFDCFKIALDLEPEHPQANLGMGIVLHRRCKITEGERLLRKSIERSPKSAEAYAALGHNLAEQGRIDEGLAAARHACELDPQLTYAHNNLLFFSLYDYRIAAEERSAIHRRWGQSIISPPPSSGKIRRTRHRRLRIGYVSADFRGHAVSFFIESVLELHDHSAFEIYCYSDVKETDLVTDRIKRRADHWISIAGKTDLEVATQIQLDEIDVLVDLVAHTADGRLGLFAQRQAPVQVSYIGYPWTTGLPAIGYRISDQYLDPPGPDDQLYVEKTVRVDGFWSYRPMDLCPPVSELPALKGEPFTFGSFNNVSKLNDLVLETWARILTRVPGSNLMLKYKGLDDPGIAERILGIFEKAGIDRDRIELFALTSLVEHMAQHNHVDLGLDPFPFNGGTTTFHSVYMGVPVITLEGRGHAERMGSAILSHVGLPEFITKSVDEYVDRAVQLANDLPKLAAIRTSLRQRLQQSALMDAPRHTRQLEAAFVQMYEEQTAEGAETGLSNGLPGASDPSQIEKTVHPSANGSIQFSVIICGRDAERREKSQAAFSTLLHDAGFEFIYAKNPYSLASGYNAAVQEATAELMIFCHDDIEILSPDAAVILQRYLSTCDIVGIAGTDHLIAGSWISSGPPHIFGQFAHRHPAGDRFALYVYGVFDSMPKIQALDGLFLAMRREVLKTIRFDETNFDGFHLYDIDFTFAAYLAGFKIAVALDLFVIHDSGGSYDLNWDFYRRRFIKKYSTHMLEFPTANPTLDQRYLPSREKLLAMMNGVASKSAPLFDNQIRPG